ncbi:MAG: Acetyl esterase [Steroidobacteraceae bacterium]|nr:Acetyl esterase [Steroidobacteraceae bacterium]
MKRRSGVHQMLMVLCASISATSLGAAEVKGTLPHVTAEGTVEIPAFAAPFSAFASEEARKSYLHEHSPAFYASPVARIPMLPIAEQRATLDKYYLDPLIARARQRYAVTIEPRTIAGVYTEVITPAEGVARDRDDRVLINLHGGGFTMGARTNGQLESIPVAGLGKYRIIAVDYRQGPEHRFPAASEDVAAVYRELLKTYRPEHIGIFGCSAGGLLAAESLAWFQKEKLPAPGAVGIFCASAGHLGDGDSGYMAPALNGRPVPPPGAAGALSQLVYFEGADPRDALVSPVDHPDVLAKFPPTLLITATRDMAMSAALHTHRQLVKAGVEADLHVWDGLQHYFFGDVDLPESREAFQVMVDFFDRHLAGRPVTGNRIATT